MRTDKELFNVFSANDLRCPVLSAIYDGRGRWIPDRLPLRAVNLTVPTDKAMLNVVVPVVLRHREPINHGMYEGHSPHYPRIPRLSVLTGQLTSDGSFPGSLTLPEILLEPSKDDGEENEQISANSQNIYGVTQLATTALRARTGIQAHPGHLVYGYSKRIDRDTLAHYFFIPETHTLWYKDDASVFYCPGIPALDQLGFRTAITLLEELQTFQTTYTGNGPTLRMASGAAIRGSPSRRRATRPSSTQRIGVAAIRPRL